jgi:hypothetical protein
MRTQGTVATTSACSKNAAPDRHAPLAIGTAIVIAA